jgi:ketosteroid isomerase-like protein
VFDRLSEGISEGRFEELSALYAEDTVVEHPQRVPRPGRIEGRQTIHEHFTTRLARMARLKRHNAVVHETTDPEVIVAEFDYTAESFESGKTCEFSNLQVLRVRDGLIVHSRDYHDYLRLAALRDSLGEIAEAYATAPPRELTPIPPRPTPAPRETPRGVFERLVYGVSDLRVDELPLLYAEETQVTHPFLPGAPVLRTRDDLREHFGGLKDMEVGIQARDLVTYQGTDPEILIGEFDYQGRAGGGPEFRISNAFVLRIRNGLIVESRDYGDHLGIAGQNGDLPRLFERLTA